MRYLTADDEKDLSRYFSGELLAQMGVRSVVGGHLDRCKEGITTRKSESCGYEMDERALEAAIVVAKVERTLACLPASMARVLSWYYTPPTMGQVERLDRFGLYALVASRLTTGGRERLISLLQRARLGAKKPEAIEANTAICAIIRKSMTRVASAKRAYARALPPPAPSPWYTLRGCA